MSKAKESEVTVAAVQPPYPKEESLEAHLECFERAIAALERAAEMGCDYVCLPEYFNCIGLRAELVRERAADAESVKTRIAQLAVRYRAHIVLPVIERRGGRLFNACHLIDPQGRLAFTYDKTHITVAERDDIGVTPGGRVDVYASPHGAVGIAICYDIYFPELFSLLALKGARIIFFPSLQRSDNPRAVAAMLSTRAMDTCAFLVRSSYGTAAAGAWRPGLPYGLSCIVHPDGTILADAGRYEGFAVARIDLTAERRRPRCHGYPVEPVRKFLREDRRPELYGPLAQP